MNTEELKKAIAEIYEQTESSNDEKFKKFKDTSNPEAEQDRLNYNLISELEQLADHISFDRVKELLEEGADPFTTDYKGYTLGEKAGMKQRYDIVDLIERSKYMENL